jgi:diguanylate cyclase (GGDEF)-like protein
LTRLHNRESFERGLARALAEGPHPVTLVMIDLDRFKAINDSAGHAAGDQVLRDVAAMLQAEVRGGDLVARLGGDEFAIVLTDCSAEDAQSLAERIRASAAQIGVEYRGRRLSIGASIGLADARAAGVAPAELMASADAACYEAKRSGRDAVRMAATAGLRLVGS